MKPLLLASVAVIGLGTAAVAQQDESQLRLAVADALDSANLNVDVDKLSDDQVAELYAIAQEGDGGAERTKMMSIFDGAGYKHMQLGDEMIYMGPDMTEMMPEGANSLRDEVAMKLQSEGFDVKADSLTDDQVAKIYAVVQNSDTEASRARIKTILE